MILPTKHLTKTTGLARELFSVAPMVDVTDPHFHFFCRLLTKHAWLYTEMINVNAVLNSKKPYFF
jgi:tRNA-dihydrouridine synthase A